LSEILRREHALAIARVVRLLSAILVDVAAAFARARARESSPRARFARARATRARSLSVATATRAVRRSEARGRRHAPRDDATRVPTSRRVATERRTDADARELARARDGDDADARSVRARVALGARASRATRRRER